MTSMKSLCNRSFSAAILLGVMLSGCKEGPARGPVRGHVTLGDQPVRGATIAFENLTLGVTLTAVLNDDGTYEVKTYKGDGLPAGEYTVTVTPGRMLQSADEIPLAGKNPEKAIPKNPSPIPVRYSSPSTSGLTADVKAGSNPPFDFRLER